MGDLTYHDYLIQRGKQYKEKHSKLAQDKSGTETDGCTFKPKILNKKFTGKQDPEQTTDNNKWMELYQQAHKKRAIDKKNLDKDEADL